MFFYFFEMIYLYISSKQIRYGFPVDHIDLRWLTQYDTITAQSNSIFYKIPFLFEIQNFTDYLACHTSLTFDNWIILEEIIKFLYANKCNSIGKLESRSYGEEKKFGSKKMQLIFLVAIIVYYFIFRLYYVFH